jgi:Ca2+-binding EF-hand superfamily protein
MFRRMDRNDDGRLTRQEYYNKDAVREDMAVRERFRVLDRNDDGRLTSREAQMSDSTFRSADYDRNGYLSMMEYVSWTRRSATNLGTGFDALDRNHDGRISWNEYRGDRDTFVRLDRNDDRYLSRAEFENRPVSNSGGGSYGGTIDEFRALDRNDDGVLTRSESRMGYSEFDRADLNNDGVLTLKEYSNTSNVSGNDQFDVLDRNNDGLVSRWEWNGNRDDFDRMDRNGDGVLSRSEFDRRSSGGGFLGSILGRVEDTRFNDLDVNNDGVLTSSEWRGPRSEFERLDTNNDGVLDVYEFTR